MRIREKAESRLNIESLFDSYSDVSRWGRFQDVDEAAHYEFLCRSAGIPVRYCAEPFENDGSPVSSIMKNLKRTMAAEFSRELGVKVDAGQRRLARLGFWVTGMAGYGLRRMMVPPDGCRKLILKDGEHKAIHTDRTILVPGPKKEVKCICTIFTLASKGRTPQEIAKELNNRHMPLPRGRPWGRLSVYRILTNEKYTGCNTYGKTTHKLRSVCRMVDRELWSKNAEAFTPIVSRDVFDVVQKQLRTRKAPPIKSDNQLIQEMKILLAGKGQLTYRILKDNRIFTNSSKRFGSIMKAYEIAGYRPSPRSVKLSDSQVRVRLLRKDLYVRLKTLFPNRLRFFGLPGQQLKQVVEIDRRIRLAVYLCRSVSNHSGDVGWKIRLRPLDRHLPILICTMDKSFSELLDFYVVPPPQESMHGKTLREGQHWLSSGRKLTKLEDLCGVASEVARAEVCEACIVVDDIQIFPCTWTVTVGNQEVSLGQAGSAILSVLVRNAGQPVSRDRLRHATRDPIDLTNIDKYVWTVRYKLGVENRKRIQTIPGVGYMYASPEREQFRFEEKKGC